jgi:glycosyltransferase involved in cell wall biosynthesis
LHRTIVAVFEQDYPNDRYEVLVVDNGSTDDTAKVAADLKADATVPFRVIVEPQLGVSRARNRAAREAALDFIAYLDDDTIPSRNWLTALDETIEKHDALVVGGRVDDVYEEGFEPPPWLACGYIRGFFRLEHTGSPPVFRVRYPFYIGEGNCAYARDLFDHFQFPPGLGAGNKRGSGGGALLDLILERHDVPIYFTDHAAVRHTVGSHRITRTNFMKAAYLHGVEMALLELEAKGRLRNVLGSTRNQLRQLPSPKMFCTFCKLIRTTSFVLESFRLLAMRSLGIDDPGGYRGSARRSPQP